MVPAKHFLVFLLFALALLPRSSYESSLKQTKLGLYDSTDKVKILTHLNFRNEILDRNHSTCVEFYNTYCGHCRNFAPHYKKLAEELYGWRDVLPITAIDCADEDNNGICREYEIMSYPTIRYFGPAFQPSAGSYGKPIHALDLPGITNHLAQFLAAENKTSNMPSWPDLQAVQASKTKSLFDGLDSLKTYVVLVYESENSTVGVETILHFSRYPDIAVKRITDPEVADKYQIDGKTYKIATVNRQGFVVPYTVVDELSSAYKDTITSFLNSQHITERPDIKPETSSYKSIANTGEPQDKILEIIEEVKRNKHLVYQADLEMAVRTTLRNEIAKSSHINGEKLLALQRFLTVLDRYSPMGPSGQLMIKRLAEYTSTHSKELSGEDFENKVKELETELGPIYSSGHFVGCAGSQAGLRGFTCSLWQLFHFMSIQAANSNTSENPLEVLQAMHGYIKYFFGCTECSEHFQAMALRRKWLSPTSKDEAVLWLWEAHNEVNNRLAGDATEDPEFPKIQFPSISSCSQCHRQIEKHSTTRSADKWNKTHVLQFLKNIYNPEYVSRYGLNYDEILEPTLDKTRQKRMISKVFSDMDVGMGVFLYGFCIVVLVAGFKLFAVKGGYRKRPYGQDMLGKV